MVKYTSWGRRLVKQKKNSIKRILTIIIGIIVNCIFGYIAYESGMPLYLDMIGTFGATLVGGSLPGMVVGVASNILCSTFNHYSIYFSVISAISVFCTMWVIGKYKEKQKITIVLIYLLIIALINGVLGTIIQFLIFGCPQFEIVAKLTEDLSSDNAGMIFFAILINTGINLVEKSLSFAVAVLVAHFIPQKLKTDIRNSGWKQKPNSIGNVNINSAVKKGNSIQRRTNLLIIVSSSVLVMAMAFVSIVLHYKNERNLYTENAVNAARFAAKVVDADKIDEYIEKGRDVSGYSETEALLYDIRDNSQGVQYLYVIKIMEDGCCFAFDCETENVMPYEPGDKIEFEKAFEEYLPDLFAGKELDPIESDDISGWVLTAYYPIRDAEGVTRGYAGADVSMEYMSKNILLYIVKTLLVISGFMFMILSYASWLSRYYMANPIKGITEQTIQLAFDSDDEQKIEDSVRQIWELDVRTDDEIEALYDAVCKMSMDISEQFKSLKKYAETTAKMQNGLIVTMADMVENRDSDTGMHIQKTAAYVKIVAYGLKKKGYYPEKIDEKFLSDVEMSAPLHDVGKISIPDNVLNKPGKLTDEEYEIMKTHTTAGKEIIEKAINLVQGESYLKEARNMAAFHHERWDGKGYPEGLKGEEIPLAARIMAVADVFDALVSKRVYKPAFSFEKALEIMKEGAGTQFDPKCVEVFLEDIHLVKVVMEQYNG